MCNDIEKVLIPKEEIATIVKNLGEQIRTYSGLYFKRVLYFL